MHIPTPRNLFTWECQEESWDDNNSTKQANPCELSSPLRIYFSLNPTLLHATDSHPLGSLTTFLPASPCCVLPRIPSIMNKLPDSQLLHGCYLHFLLLLVPEFCLGHHMLWSCFSWRLLISSLLHCPTHTHTQTHRSYTLYHVAWRKSCHSTHSTLFYQVDYSSTLHWSLNNVSCSYCCHLMTSWPLLHIHGGLVHLVHTFLFSSSSLHLPSSWVTSIPTQTSHLELKCCLLFHWEKQDPQENCLLPYPATYLNIPSVSILSSSPPSLV